MSQFPHWYFIYWQKRLNNENYNNGMILDFFIEKKPFAIIAHCVVGSKVGH